MHLLSGSFVGSGRLLMLVLGATLLWGGCKQQLGYYTKKSARRTLSKLEKVRIKFDDTDKKLKALVDEDAEFMNKTRTVKDAKRRLEKIRGQMKVLGDKGRKMTKLLDRNKRSDGAKVRRMTREMEASLNRIRVKLVLLIKPVRDLRNAKKNAKKLIRELKRTRAAIDSYPPPNVTKEVEQAGKKYPQAKTDIAARVEALKGKTLLTLVQAFDKAHKKQPPDYLAMGRLATGIRSRFRQLEHDRGKLMTQLGELDDHVDLILIDMKEERGRFFHKYKSVRGRSARRTAWRPVSASYYRMHTDHLGMALYAKPKGTFHTRALTLASPPGYVYVGHAEYGEWKRGGTEKTWIFKPKYKYMLALFFAGMAAVTYAAYHSFRKARLRRVVWFGLAGAILYGTRSRRMRHKHKSYYTRKARKAAARRARRIRARRYRSRSRFGK